MPVMVYDKIDEIPEALRANAKEIEGKFHLDGAGLLSKNQELLGEVQQYKDAAKRLKEFGDIDPAKAKQALQEMTTIEERRRAIEGEVTKAVTNASQEWQRKVEAKDQEVGQFKTALEKKIVDGALADEIHKQEGNPDFVAHHLRNQVKTVFENGEYVAKVMDPKTGVARVNAKGEPMSIAELVTEAKADKRFAGAFLAPTASGSGAQSSATNPNPGGAKGTITLTRAQALDARQYREAMKQVGNDATKIVVKD